MPETQTLVTDDLDTSNHGDGRRRQGISNQLSALDFISNLLTETGFDLQPLLDEIVRITAERMHMKACTIRLLDRETNEMVLKASYGLSKGYLFKGPVIADRSIFRELIERCCEENDVVEVYGVGDDPRMQYAREAVSEGIHSLLAAPLVHDGDAVGALSVFTAEPHRFDEEERRVFKTIANQASVAISLAQLYHEKLELDRIEHELDIAADIQRKLMPDGSPSLSGFEIAGHYRPSREIGGDFYDFIKLPEDNLGIAVGDVSGKGIPASLLMATVRMALRVQAENIFAMREVMGKVNRAVYDDTRPEEFVTLFYGVLNAETRILTYVNAGHNTAVLLRGDDVVRLDPDGPPVGILPDLLAGQETVQLDTGDMIAVFTDGYPDTEGDDGRSFGENRVLEVLRESRGLPVHEIMAALERAIVTFKSRSPAYVDDRTVVLIKAE